MPTTNSLRGGPVLLAQAGREGLINYTFVLEAPWKACRLCGSVYQSDLDRAAYEAQDPKIRAKLNLRAKEMREAWLVQHNKHRHPWFDDEMRLLQLSGMPVTAEAAAKLSTYGIVLIGPTTYEDEVAQALAEAPRAPINDAEGT